MGMENLAVKAKPNPFEPQAQVFARDVVVTIVEGTLSLDKHERSVQLQLTLEEANYTRKILRFMKDVVHDSELRPITLIGSVMPVRQSAKHLLPELTDREVLQVPRLTVSVERTDIVHHLVLTEGCIKLKLLLNPEMKDAFIKEIQSCLI